MPKFEINYTPKTLRKMIVKASTAEEAKSKYEALDCEFDIVIAGLAEEITSITESKE